MNTCRILLRTGLALALALATISCRTIQYREVQSDFERAVAAENARAESPFVDWYQGVAATLTDDFIGKLDEKLRPNAWMLRGVAEWRSGNYAKASTSAENGTREISRQNATAPNLASSRDGIVLTMLPGLVQDSKLRDRLHTFGTNDLPLAAYQSDFRQQFEAAVTVLCDAKQQFAAPTPAAAKLYWNYHAWRILQNWSFTLGKLPAGEPTTQAAYTAVDHFLANQCFGQDVTNRDLAIDSVKEAIPADHPYRHLIELQENE